MYIASLFLIISIGEASTTGAVSVPFAPWSVFSSLVQDGMVNIHPKINVRASIIERILFIFDLPLGFRLGYGGGFYDRFLKDFDGVTVGFVRDGFYFEGLPREEFDLPIDITVKRSEVKYNEI